MTWLIPEARQWWRLWSVRLLAAAAAIDALQLLPLVGYVPRPIADLLPHATLEIVQGVLLIAALVARFVKQSKLRKPNGG